MGQADPKQGYFTSELQLLVFSMGFLWSMPGVSEEVAAYITGAVVIAYLAARTYLKGKGQSGSLGLLGGSVDVETEVSVSGSVGPTLKPSGPGAAGTVAAFVVGSMLALGIGSCSTLGGLWSTPLSGPAETVPIAGGAEAGPEAYGPPAPLELQLPGDTGSIAYTPPEPPVGASDPISISLPQGGGQVQYTPPTPTVGPQGPTVGDAVGQVVGGIAATATGLPWLALLVPALLGALGRRRQVAP